jgi:hypothetical protein
MPQGGSKSPTRLPLFNFRDVFVDHTQYIEYPFWQFVQQEFLGL